MSMDNLGNALTYTGGAVAVVYDLGARVVETTNAVWLFINDTSGAFGVVGCFAGVAINLYFKLHPTERRKDDNEINP